MMKEFRNPVFALGVLSIIIFVIGIFLLSSSTHYGNIVLFTGVIMGTIFTLFNIVSVARTSDVRGEKKIFWLLIVVLVPVLGSFIYYIFTGKNENPTIS